MEANKENYCCSAGKSRIPLPLDPLPPVPKHLTTEYRKKQENDVRRTPFRVLDPRPDQNIQTGLKTCQPINAFSQSGPSREKCVLEKCASETLPPVPNHNKKQETDDQRPSIYYLDSQAGPSREKHDMKYVTMRQKGDQNLDWGLKVFEDNEPTSGDFSPKDTDEKDIFNDAIILEENELPQLHDVILAGSQVKPPTPTNKPSLLEPAQVRNLKKSLKRPHSRELQGLSPLAKERKRLEAEKLKRQVSNQNRERRLSYKLRPPDYITIQLTDCLSQYTPEIFDYLLKSEKMAYPTQFIPKVTRACVVNWMMKVNGPDGSSAVLQKACWFLDSVFERRSTPVAQLQLIASACFWVAMKLEEPGLTSGRLVKVSNGAFTECQLLAAERDVLILLGFPRQPVVPHDYISYLSWVCDSQHHGEIEMTATFITMCSLLFHTNYCCEQPSVVAAAAMWNACICLERRLSLTHLTDKLGKCQLYRKAEAKAINFKRTCSAQRIAVMTVLAPDFEYKAPFTHYGQPPLNLAQTVGKIIKTFSALDDSIIGLRTFKF